MAFDSVNLGVLTYNYPADEFLPFARTLEETGFGTFWFGEHYIIPKKFKSVHTTGNDTGAIARSIIGPDIRLHDPWFVLGAIAGATSRLRVGTSVSLVPLNHPLLLARSTVSAAQISGGRFLYGTGIGWLEEEFDALGVPFRERGRRLEEALEILKLAWGGGYFSYEGKHFRCDELQISPAPVAVPLIMGGNSDIALKRCARMGDGWLNSATISLEQAKRSRERLECLREEVGTSGRPFSYHVRPEGIERGLVEQFVEAGFENIVLWGPSLWPNTGDLPLAAKIDGLRRHAQALGLV